MDSREIDPRRRGYHAAYRDGEVNHCPGCSRTHWLIGRVNAECAFCSTALPLAATMTQIAAAPEHWNGRRQQLELVA